MKEIEQKIANLTNENQFKADQAAVQAAQMEMLTTLRSIREAMVSSKDSGASSKELEALKEENENLKKINMKQRYRIDHLIDGIKDMQQQLAK